eukprot:840231-Pleurochrysis_carterae.AAC.4
MKLEQQARCPSRREPSGAPASRLKLPSKAQSPPLCSFGVDQFKQGGNLVRQARPAAWRRPLPPLLRRAK